ncbi:hypothetical protein CB1_000831001 [Camelus ferus]|nr:hypothetical protein CB1_000831001 [Camelus ferus]
MGLVLLDGSQDSTCHSLFDEAEGAGESPEVAAGPGFPSTSECLTLPWRCAEAAPQPGYPRQSPDEFGAEFRRFSLDRQKPGKFEDFYKLVVHTHHISNTEVAIGYADVHGDLLPINNDDNFCKAVSSASPLLRVFIQRRAPLLCSPGLLSGLACGPEPTALPWPSQVVVFPHKEAGLCSAVELELKALKLALFAL